MASPLPLHWIRHSHRWSDRIRFRKIASDPRPHPRASVLPRWIDPLRAGYLLHARVVGEKNWICLRSVLSSGSNEGRTLRSTSARRRSQTKLTSGVFVLAGVITAGELRK